LLLAEVAVVLPIQMNQPPLLLEVAVVLVRLGLIQTIQ
jgi:hypothetical protein